MSVVVSALYFSELARQRVLTTRIRTPVNTTLSEFGLFLVLEGDFPV